MGTRERVFKSLQDTSSLEDQSKQLPSANVIN
ncbi:hypothetical protein CsSME_00043815 [Camellia sinensis var. sinensis]